MKPFKIIKKNKIKNIIFNKDLCFGLIGSNKNIILSEIVKKKKFNCKIFNKKKHKNIETFFKEIDILISYDNHFIFPKENIDNFKYQILNIHGSLLPNFAGRGTYSNMILLDNSMIGSTLHIVGKRVDFGEILMHSQKLNTNKNALPNTYLKKTEKLSFMLLKEFLVKIKNNYTFELFSQNENLRFFSKKYISSFHGEIDWNWRGNEIVKFVRAFSKPYRGSFSYLNNSKKKIHIKKLKYTKAKSHPFLIGKIFQYNSLTNKIKICVIDGFVEIDINDLSINKNKSFLDKLEGKYFIKKN